MTHKRRSKCAAKKYNLKILRRYHSLYPRDTYFASLPASCLHREEVRWSTYVVINEENNCAIFTNI